MHIHKARKWKASVSSTAVNERTPDLYKTQQSKAIFAISNQIVGLYNELATELGVDSNSLFDKLAQQSLPEQ